MDTHNNAPLMAELVAVKPVPPIDLRLRAIRYSDANRVSCAMRRPVKSPYS